MAYSFTSPEVARALVRAKRRGVDVGVVLDWKS
ncbi:Endonuclease [Salmonella enterica subsp. arizonae]|nr:Endonuclease [Salmonella enterica subsp. arizonae]